MQSTDNQKTENDLQTEKTSKAIAENHCNKTSHGENAQKVKENSINFQVVDETVKGDTSSLSGTDSTTTNLSKAKKKLLVRQHHISKDEHERNALSPTHGPIDSQSSTQSGLIVESTQKSTVNDITQNEDNYEISYRRGIERERGFASLINVLFKAKDQSDDTPNLITFNLSDTEETQTNDPKGQSKSTANLIAKKLPDREENQTDNFKNQPDDTASLATIKASDIEDNQAKDPKNQSIDTGKLISFELSD